MVQTGISFFRKCLQAGFFLDQNGLRWVMVKIHFPQILERT